MGQGGDTSLATDSLTERATDCRRERRVNMKSCTTPRSKGNGSKTAMVGATFNAAECC